MVMGCGMRVCSVVVQIDYTDYTNYKDSGSMLVERCDVLRGMGEMGEQTDYTDYTDNTYSG